MARSPTRKRPCRVCKRWFIPHPRLKGVLPASLHDPQ